MLTNGNGSYGNNNFNNNNQTGDKPRTNFRFGRIKQTDGTIEFAVWVSDYGITAKMVIKQAVGKDPSNGSILYENKSPVELPTAYLDREKMRQFIEILEQNNYQNINFGMSGMNNSFQVASDGNNFKITITNTKNNDTRSITLEGTNINGKVINAPMMTIVSWMKLAYKKSLTCRVEDLVADSAQEGSNEEAPF